MTMRMLCSTSSTVMPCLFRSLTMLFHVLGFGPRQSGGRFVEQKKARFAGERTREFKDFHFAIA